MRFIEQFLQHIEFLVGLRIPFVAEQNHLDNLFAILLQVLFQRALEVGGLYPCHIVLLSQQFIVYSSLFHIDIHVCGNLYQIVTCFAIFLLIVITEDVVDVLVFYPFFGKIVFVTNRQGQLVLNSIDENGIAQNVAVECQQERKTARVDTLKEGAFAETHHALACTA